MLRLVRGIASIRELIESGDPSVRVSVQYEKPQQYDVGEAIADVKDLVDPSPELYSQFIVSRTVIPPGRSLTYLRDCIVMPNAAIITSGGALIRESCFPYGDRNRILKRFHPWIVEEGGEIFAEIDPLEQVNTPVLYLREHGEMGFFHWMHSVFPRIDVVRSQKLSPEFSLLVQDKARFQLDSLKLYDRNNRNIVEPSLKIPQHFSELLFPHPLVENGDFWLRPPSIKNFYSELSLPASKGSRRVYITRQDAGMRRLENDADLQKLLQLHGFIAVELGRLRFEEQLALFRDAELVVGVHGAGLSHIVNMTTHSGVLEIIHPRRFWPTYRAIAARTNLSYAFVIGEDPGPTMSGNSFDFDIDLAKFERVLIRLMQKACDDGN